jgi:hypothetical protein
MSDVQTDPAPFPANRYRAVSAALAQWDRLRAGRPMPTRDDLDPRDLAEALEFLFVAEPVAPGVARIRLAGRHLTQLLGMEPRGMPLCALFEAEARAEIAAGIEQVLHHGARVILPLRAAGGLGRPALEGMLALMPLADAEGRITRLLGVLQTRGAIGRTPRRLGLAGPARPLTGADMPAHAPAFAPASAPRRAEAPAPAPARPARPALRVIRGGRA